MKPLYVRQECFPQIVQKLNQVSHSFSHTLTQPSSFELLSIKRHVYAEFLRLAEKMEDKFIDFYEGDTDDRVSHKKVKRNTGVKQMDAMRKQWKLEDNICNEFIPWTFGQDSELLVSMNEEMMKK